MQAAVGRFDLPAVTVSAARHVQQAVGPGDGATCDAARSHDQLVDAVGGESGRSYSGVLPAASRVGPVDRGLVGLPAGPEGQR